MTKNTEIRRKIVNSAKAPENDSRKNKEERKRNNIQIFSSSTSKRKTIKIILPTEGLKQMSLVQKDYILKSRSKQENMSGECMWFVSRRLWVLTYEKKLGRRHHVTTPKGLCRLERLNGVTGLALLYATLFPSSSSFFSLPYPLLEAHVIREARTL